MSVHQTHVICLIPSGYYLIFRHLSSDMIMGETLQKEVVNNYMFAFLGWSKGSNRAA